MRVLFTANRFRFAWCDEQRHHLVVVVGSVVINIAWLWLMVYIRLAICGFFLPRFSVRSMPRSCMCFGLSMLNLRSVRFSWHVCQRTLLAPCLTDAPSVSDDVRNHLLHDNTQSVREQHNASAATAAAGNLLESKCFYSVWRRWRWYCTVGCCVGGGHAVLCVFRWNVLPDSQRCCVLSFAANSEAFYACFRCQMVFGAVRLAGDFVVLLMFPTAPATLETFTRFASEDGSPLPFGNTATDRLNRVHHREQHTRRAPFRYYMLVYAVLFIYVFAMMSAGGDGTKAAIWFPKLPSRIVKTPGFLVSKFGGCLLLGLTWNRQALTYWIVQMYVTFH